MADRNILTEVVLEVRKRLELLRQDIKTAMPTPFMAERLESREFQKRYGFPLREYRQLQSKYGVQEMEDLLKGLDTLGGENATTSRAIKEENAP